MKISGKCNYKDLDNNNISVLTRYEKTIYIKIILLYLTFTIILFALGPIKYDVRNPLILYPYVLLSFFMLYLGFMITVNKKKYSITRKYNYTENPLRMFKIITFIYIALIPITLYARTGSFFFDFSKLLNLGEAYLDRYYYISSRGRSYGEWIRIIFSPLTVAYIPLGYLYWDEISKTYKSLFIIGIVSNLFLDISSGTNKALADFIIFSFVLFLIRNIKSVRFNFPTTEGIGTLKRNIKKVELVIIGMLIIFMIFFSQVMESRLGGIYFDPWNTNYKHPLIMILPNDTLRQGAVSFTSYLTQGYHALDLSLEKTFESTFGFGSSMYILDSTEKWFSTDYFIRRSYIYKNHVQDGWDSKIKWSSFYVWIANDVSFIGALIIIYWIGKILGACWRKVIYTKEVESLVLLCILTQLCFYIPANNQVMQLAESLVSTLFWLMLWVANCGLDILERR